MSILNDPYLKEQLITYIGNKRKLIPLIYKALNTSSCSPGMRFLDLFSGSGVVSRLGRLMGFQVISNDWEEYARILGESHLSLCREDLSRLFGSESRLQALLDSINSLPTPSDEEGYMSRYYAPSHMDIQKADYRRERLFYTRENALRIDAIRNFIDREFPSGRDERNEKTRALLIALLLGEASKHTNTSGVFKAYHKGFGGHGKDALNRILAPITLPFPRLPSGLASAEIHCRDANRLVRELSPVDIAYLDPPYNQHQYGSNYHILNTIALWDRLPAPLELNGKGVLREKAAIRKDWTKTRSPYCYRGQAVEAFKDVLENLDARRILVSYSNDGLIPFESMMDICENKGRVSIVSNEYTKFRGGRQSNSRLHSNIEFILAIDSSRTANSRTRNRIRHLMLLRQAALMEKKVYKMDCFPESIRGCRDFELQFGNRRVRLSWKNDFQLQIADSIVDWPVRSLRAFIARLDKGACVSRMEELETILSLIESGKSSSASLLKEIPRRVRMLAHKKTRNEFEMIIGRLEKMKKTFNLNSIDRDIEAVKIQAEKRFEE